MIFSCQCLNIKFYTLDNKYPPNNVINEFLEDEDSCPLLLDIGGISIEQPSLLKVKQHPKFPNYYVVNCCNCFYTNNSTSQNSILINNSNPIYSFRGSTDKVYDEKSILNGEVIPYDGIVILNKKNILNEEGMVTAKLNINYSEAYKLILNPQISKYSIGKTNLGDDYSKLFSLLQNSLSEYNDKQYKEMEKNVENYRNRLQLQYNAKKEKAGRDREILWNVICNINKDSPLNNRQKPTFNENVMEIPSSLQSYHQKQPYYVGSFNPSRKMKDSSFLTYHSYKMNSMMSSFVGYPRPGIRQVAENSLYDSLKKDIKELNLDSNLKEDNSKELEELKTNENDISVVESQEIEIKEKDTTIEIVEKTKSLDTTEIIEMDMDSSTDTPVQITTIKKEVEKKDNNKKAVDDYEDDIFSLDGIEDDKRNEKYIAEEDIEEDLDDESLDEIGELVNMDEAIGMNTNNQQNKSFSIYATSVPIKIPERPNTNNNEDDDSFDTDKKSEKEFTPPHVIIARTYKDEEGGFNVHKDTSRYYSMAY